MRHRNTSLYHSQVQRISITHSTWVCHTNIIAFGFHSYTSKSDMNMKYANVLRITRLPCTCVLNAVCVCVCAECGPANWNVNRGGRNIEWTSWVKPHILFISGFQIHLSMVVLQFSFWNQFNSRQFSFCSRLPHAHTHSHSMNCNPSRQSTAQNDLCVRKLFCMNFNGHRPDVCVWVWVWVCVCVC